MDLRNDAKDLISDHFGFAGFLNLFLGYQNI